MANEKLVTIYSQHTTFIQRLGATDGRKVLPFLELIENDVVEILNRYRKRKITPALRADIQEQISKVTKEHLQAYTSQLKVSNRALGAYEAEFAATTLGRIIEEDGLSPVIPSAAAINARAISMPIKLSENNFTSYTSMMKNYWGKYADEMDAIVLDGFVNAKSMPEVTNSILSKMELSKSGTTKTALDRARRSAKQLAITGNNHYANNARVSFVDANNDILKGYVFLAVNDSRTSSRCRSLDQQTFPSDYNKLSSITPPLHPNCRSALSYDVDDRFKLDDTETKRASSFEVDGKRNPKPIDSDGIYYENMKRLEASDQDAILGPTMGKAFRKLDNPKQFAQLTLDNDHNPLTIAQMKERNNALGEILRAQGK